MWRIFFFVATLAVAACDSSVEDPGTEPTSTTDTSIANWKEDNSNPPDTTAAPDSDGGINNDTMVTETINANQCPVTTLTQGQYCELDDCWLTQNPAPGCEWKCSRPLNDEVAWVWPTAKAESHCISSD